MEPRKLPASVTFRMFENPRALLEAFFAIPQSEIDQELAGAREAIDHIRWEISHLIETAVGAPREHSVRFHHLLLVQAYVMSRRHDAPLEIKVRYAQVAAVHLAGEAGDAIYISPRGVELCRRIDAIKEREGLSDDDEDVPGSPEYHRLEAEFSAMMREASDEVFLLALRRYRMDELAAFHQSEPDEWRLLEEIGSRALDDALDPRRRREMTEAYDRYVLKTHGPATLRRIRERVEELREQVTDIEGPWPTRGW